MSSEFTNRKLAWLETVACERTLPRSAVALAVLLATRYFNGESGEAWPSEHTLARDLGITQANAHMAAEKLIAAKFLHRRSGGPRTTNRYSIPRRWRAPERYCRQYNSDIADNITSDIAHNSAAILPAILEPGNEPVKGTREGTPRRLRRSESGDVPLKGSDAKSSPRRPRQRRITRRGRAAPLPRGWECGQAELAAAAASLAAWGPDRARREFDKFRTWHADRANRSADWAASWRTWCTKGSEIDKRERSRPRDRVAAAAHGAAGWYEEQKRRAAARREDPP